MYTLSLAISTGLLSLLLYFEDCQSYFVTDLFLLLQFSYFGQDRVLNLLQTRVRGFHSDDDRPIKNYFQNSTAMIYGPSASRNFLRNLKIFFPLKMTVNQTV